MPLLPCGVPNLGLHLAAVRQLHDPGGELHSHRGGRRLRRNGKDSGLRGCLAWRLHRFSEVFHGFSLVFPGFNGFS